MFSDSQIVALCSELNHLLWTNDTPQPTAEDHLDGLPIVGQNMQCVAHSFVTAALIARQGDSVVLRSGSALIVYPELPPNHNPHWVAKHWWFTTSNGVCDLSLNLSPVSAHKPIIFRNSNVAALDWRVLFKHDFRTALETARRLQSDKLCGVIYETGNKSAPSLREIEAELDKPFSASEKAGCPVTFRQIVRHCERFLKGGQSLQGVSQVESWHRLQAENCE